MLPLAPKYGIRVITMNCRDYRGSTPYTPEELGHMTDPDLAVQASAVRRWGREIGQFLEYVCKTLHIPAGTTGQAGGVVLAAWSMSGIASLSILGDPETLGTDLAQSLAPYVRKVILYDSPAISYGASPEIGIPWPFSDPTLSPEDIPYAFTAWASSYCAPLPDGVPITPETLRAHHEVLPRMPTLRTLPPAEFARMTDLGASTRSLLIMNTDPSIRQAHARRAFCDADAVLPHVDVLALWCDHTVWQTALGAKAFLELASGPADPGKRKRRTAFIRLRGANHFLHWDDPERMVRLLADTCICSPPAPDFEMSKL